MRQRARTDPSGGRSVMSVPTGSTGLEDSYLEVTKCRPVLKDSDTVFFGVVSVADSVVRQEIDTSMVRRTASRLPFASGMMWKRIRDNWGSAGSRPIRAHRRQLCIVASFALTP
jgi:hypothetical protein